MNHWLETNLPPKFISVFIIIVLSGKSLLGFEQQENDTLIVDLQQLFINKTTEISLAADWEFYWHKLIPPGHFNNEKPTAVIALKSWTNLELPQYGPLPSFGYATYRLNFKISKKRPHISLYVPRLYSAAKTWVNGELISENGIVSTTKEKALHRRFSQIIPLNSDKTDFEIVIQVSNFYHNKAGIAQPLIIGTSHHLESLKAKRIIADMLYIGCLGFVGAFFIIFFLFYWSKDRAVLYFGAMCLSLSYMALSDRYAPIARINDSVSWILLTKFEYISLFLAGKAAISFFSTIFSRFIFKSYPKLINYVFWGLVVIVLVLPAPHFTKFVLPFLLFMMLNLVYVFLVITKAVLKKRQESILMLVSMLLGTAVFCIHIFVFLGTNENIIILVNFGYILVFLLLSMLLMMRFSSSFKDLEKAKEYAFAQRRELSMKSNELSLVNHELKENLTRLENYNSELDSFNHIVSHDLKAPLVAMHSLITFIEEDLADILKDESKEHFSLLKERLSKMNALINGLLEYSKVAKGNKHKAYFSLNDLLTEVVEIVNHKNTNKIYLPERDRKVFGSRIQLGHVFQNLISNAIKHNDKLNATIHISVQKKQKEYVFSVKDNGPGIEEKYHSKIFDMFSQLNTNSEVESTGIGLSIVKKLVSENHGTISVSSEMGIGTTISFTWKM